MFKIIVDNIERGCYSDNCGAVTVGSAADAQVRLPSAAAEHLKIYPLDASFGGCFKVTLHARDGMTHHTKHWTGKRQTVKWTTDPPGWLVPDCDIENIITVHGLERPGWVLLYEGDSMTVRDHVIQVIRY